MEDITLPLKEIVDKGFPEPHLVDMVKPGSYKFIDRSSSVLHEAHVERNSSREYEGWRVGFYFDGQFLPVRNGASYTLYNLMRSLAASGKVDPTLVNCFRGWDDPEIYSYQEFRSVFIHPRDYYHQTDVIEESFRDCDLQAAQFYNSEILLNLSNRLKRMGSKILYEVQNIDHVLLQRLDASTNEVNTARTLQLEAFNEADHIFCRSEIDKKEAIALGASERKVSTYKGGINVRDFTFEPRIKSKGKLVYLGHMYYQPNENALDHLASEVMPSLDDNCTLTVIGNTHPVLLEKYEDPRITFLEGVDDLDAELLKHDIALAPIFEGSGTRLKVLDYLASGLPVIATSVSIEGLNPELGKFVTIEDDITMFATRIKSVMIDPTRFAYRSYIGRMFVEKEYDWPLCIGPFLQAYEKLIVKNERK